MAGEAHRECGFPSVKMYRKSLIVIQHINFVCYSARDYFLKRGSIFFPRRDLIARATASKTAKPGVPVRTFNACASIYFFFLRALQRFRGAGLFLYFMFMFLCNRKGLSEGRPGLRAGLFQHHLCWTARSAADAKHRSGLL